MVQEAMWPAIIVSAVVALFFGFLVGRFAGGSRKKADQLAAELEEKKEETERYRRQVDEHFDKTATLFVSMAGSYKELFDHLSSGYEQLSDKSARDLFRERVDAMLVGSALEHKMIEDEDSQSPAEEGHAADAVAAPVADKAAADETAADGAPPVEPDGEPAAGDEAAQAKEETIKNA